MGSRRSAPVGLIAAAFAVLAVTLTIYGLRELVPVLSTGVVYLLAVLLVSTYWRLWLGIATAVASAAAFNFFHIPPTGRFTIAEGEDWVALAVFLVAAVVTSTLADSARSRREEAERGRAEADLGAEMARILLGGTSIEESLPEVGRRIAEVFDLPSVSLVGTWTGADERQTAMPIVVEGQRAATLLVPRHTPADVLDGLEHRVVPTLEALIGATRRREQLESQVIETRALRRSNVLKTTLLRAISHDLRTPLTSIATAAGGLTVATLTDDEREEMVAIIRNEAERLSRLVDNLLDLSRLQSGAAEPRADWCSVDELVYSALAAVPAPEAGFDVRLDEGLPLVRVDAAQLERALANVLENSSRFAGSEPVVVRAIATESRVLVRISDRGPGVAKEDLERIFEPFYGSKEGPGGSGLGLAIARGFAEVNGGHLKAQSLPGQGTTFVLDLPLAAKSTPPAPEAVRAES